MSGFREYEQIRDGVRFHVVSHKGGGKGGSGGGNTSTHAPSEAPNTLRSKATARILEVLSEGPIKGLVNGLQSVYLDKTPIENPDGSRNFTVDQFQFRHGDPEQDVIEGFAAGEAEVSVGVEMKDTIPVVRRITAGVDAVRLKTRVNALYYQSPTGDVQGTGVSYVVEWNIGGAGWVFVARVTISGKTMSPYERALRVQLPKTSQTIDIRLTKDAGPTGAQYANTLYFSAYTEIVDGTLYYPDTALAGMVIDAQYFPNVPTRGYHIYGRLCQIPTNYDPVARTYTGDWDGTFKSDYTNNPAWVLYDLLLNTRFGTGADLTPANVDKWGLYECAKYNDGMVPDGKGTGGLEPRFTCNVPITTREDAYKVLNAVASCMRALLYASNDTIYVVQDRPILEWDRLFTPSNVTDGLFDYTSTDYRSKFNAASVTWNDPSQNYTPAVQLVNDPELISTQPYRDTQANAYACTVQGQAIRHGRWLIYTGQEEDEVVSFKTALENADVRPGYGILIQDPSRAGARLGGRTLEQPAKNVLKFDAPAPGILAGWKVYVTIGNAVVETTVAEVVDETLVKVTGLTDGIVPAASNWLAHDSTVEPTTWRVAAIKENGKNVYEILATKYAPGKFEYVDNGVKIPPPDYSTIPTGPLGNGTDLGLKEYIYLDNAGVPQFGVVLSWTPSTDSRVAYYMVELKGPADDYRKYGQIVGTSVDVALMRSGIWEVMLTAVDNLGRRSIPLSGSFNTVGLTAKPTAPYALYGSVNGSWLDLEWLPTDEIDVLYYWIQYSPKTDGTAVWAESTSVTTRVSRNTTRVTVPARIGTYFIKTIDSLGQESATAASVIIYRDVRPPHQIANLMEQPAWAGTKNLWVKNGNYLELPPPAVPEVVPPDIYPGTRGISVHGDPTRYSYYYFANSLDQGAVGNILAHAAVQAFGSYGDNSMSTWVPLAAAQPLAMGASNAWDVAIEIRGTQDGVNWGPWRPTTATSVDVRAIQVRLIGMLYDTQTTLRMSVAECRVDVPDRYLGANNVPFDGVGRATVVYSTGFYATPNIQFTGFATANQGTQIVIISSDKHGFTAEQRRDNGTPVGGGSFNWLAAGYGVSGP
jgi:predicted phage tail protein